MRVVGDEASGRCLNSEDGAVLNGISALKPGPFDHVKIQWKGASDEPYRGLSPNHAGALILDLPVPRL